MQVLNLVRHVTGKSFLPSVGILTLLLPVFRKGGPLAVTDANLLLGRLIPDFFPKIFGKSEKEPLDVEASKSLFEKVAKEINESHEKRLSLDEIVYGCGLGRFLVTMGALTDYAGKVHQGRQRDNVPAYSCTD